MSNEHKLNNEIPYDVVKVIHHVNGFVGEMKKSQAVIFSKDQDMDLILTNDKVNPPTCIVQDYGKYMYQQKKNIKKQKSPSIKEIKFRPTTDDHDLSIKAKKVQKFIDSGDIVRIKVVMSGRENAHHDVANETFDKFIGMINNYVFDVNKTLSGNSISTQIKKS